VAGEIWFDNQDSVLSHGVVVLAACRVTRGKKLGQSRGQAMTGLSMREH
jgi:hypothetical protein